MKKAKLAFINLVSDTKLMITSILCITKKKHTPDEHKQTEKNYGVP